MRLQPLERLAALRQRLGVALDAGAVLQQAVLQEKRGSSRRHCSIAAPCSRVAGARIADG